MKLKHSLVQRTYKNMLEYDKIDLSEGIDVNKQVILENITFVIIIIF